MFDYIIVGAGSAGCVLAHRLTENPQVKVLLLEAGGPDTRQEIHIPAAFSKLFKSDCDWAYHTEPQAGLNGRKLFWPRGKTLGGSSSINAMIYIRGHARDYDHWETLGNSGWGYRDVLPFFKKSEHQERGPSEFHGVGGPLNVADLRTVNPTAQAFVEAGAEIGLARNSDFNGAQQEGVGLYQVTQKNGRRHSTAAGFLKPALKRPNLTVYTQAQVTGLVLEKGRAVGVNYVRQGQAATARAEREVILSGGAINSPQLLMLSGIGPADELRRHGIDVRVDLPGVGQNLQDHLLQAVCYECTQPVTLASAEKLGNIINYLLFRKGPLSSNVGEGGAFVKSSLAEAVPDLQFLFGAVYYVNHGFTKVEGHGFTIAPVLVQPKSAGFLRLASADPLAAPVIEPNYCQVASDLKILVEGVKLARSIGQAKAFDKFRGAERFPGSQAKTDAELAEYVRNTVETLYHPVGTCKMGTDEMAVTDSELRVRGVAGLRVVDASVMPTIVNGNTNAPTIMIAEKAAALMNR
ncbi:MAG: choline dehydrogenase [Blastocatellia bacterium]|nr:choline dehydrogenase [Blastocatellia bacterium]